MTELWKLLNNKPFCYGCLRLFLWFFIAMWPITAATIYCMLFPALHLTGDPARIMTIAYLLSIGTVWTGAIVILNDLKSY